MGVRLARTGRNRRDAGDLDVSHGALHPLLQLGAIGRGQSRGGKHLELPIGEKNHRDLRELGLPAKPGLKFGRALPALCEIGRPGNPPAHEPEYTKGRAEERGDAQESPEEFPAERESEGGGFTHGSEQRLGVCGSG